MTNRTTRKKILFIAEAVTLAHVGRMLSLAQSLSTESFEVQVACDPRYKKAIGAVSVNIRDIHTIPASQFFDALDSGKPIYTKQDLIRYVEDDLALLNEFQPDVVVGDFRLSLAASARLRGIPYMSVTNAYWSPYAKVRYVVPDIPPTRIFGVTIAQKIFDLVRPIAFAQHAAPINGMLKHFKLPILPADLRHSYTNSDLTLYSDIPELVETTPLPNNHHFLGPIQWSPNVATPGWWPDIPSDKPIVYINFGSSGNNNQLSEILAALSHLPITVIGASAGKLIYTDTATNIFMTDYLPGDLAVALASLVICNGGSPTCYQALAAGKPIIGVPANLDQFLNMSLVESAQAGLCLRNDKNIAVRICKAVERLQSEHHFTDNAKRLQQNIAAYSPSALFLRHLMTMTTDSPSI